MFLIRQAKPTDQDALLKWAKMVHFTNLPADPREIAKRIEWSQACFQAVSRGEPVGAVRRGRVGGAGGDSPRFMFVAEDMHTRKPIGTSAIIAKMGSPGSPNYSFQLRRHDFWSEDLKTGAQHMTVKLVADEDGPTEIGGLIVAPDARAAGVGRVISFVRFHFMALHRELFEDRVLAEMMAPISDDGQSFFWESFGRRFINRSYKEADLFSQRSREFIAALFPREEVYLSLLPADAVQVVAQVGEETKPARAMLERVGFRHLDRVDPFDGGPHLECDTDQILPVKATRRADLLGAAPAGRARREALVSVERPGGSDEPFLAALAPIAESADGSGVRLPAEAMKALRAEPGMTIGVMPMDEAWPTVAGAKRAKSATPPRKRARAGAAPRTN
ncbi:MAG: arginine N-succinyltransferase [Phycisphaerales bacterium]|nr:arginine N-succinyltransferase [Phycisphaerales bacterium]